MPPGTRADQDQAINACEAAFPACRRSSHHETQCRRMCGPHDDLGCRAKRRDHHGYAMFDDYTRSLFNLAFVR